MSEVSSLVHSGFADLLYSQTYGNGDISPCRDLEKDHIF